jgi:hypothetical protein
VKFRAGELEFNASVVESSQQPSPQTGNPLQLMTIQFRAQKEGVHEAAVTEALQRQSGGLYSLDESDTPEIEWRVRESNWTYVGTEPWGVNRSNALPARYYSWATCSWSRMTTPKKSCPMAACAWRHGHWCPKQTWRQSLEVSAHST